MARQIRRSVDEPLHNLTPLVARALEPARTGRACHATPAPQLRRLVIAEAAVFPQLGQIFYDNGPGLTMSQLAVAFERLHQRRLLACPDPARTASDFNWLIMSEPINRAMLLGNDQPAADQELRQWADQAVTTFLAAYAR